jgi:CheY-like chemotaxis protein
MANKKRIMIVDDDKDILLCVKQILERNGYKVYSFDNGRDFLKALENGKKPTLILLDIMMPEMSGWDIRRRLEENPSWNRIPVVFMTARANETSEEMYERYGVGYIKKPFAVDDFKEIIENVANSKQKYSKKMSNLRFCS